MIARADHQTSRQNSDRAFEHAHVDVHLENFYVLSIQKRLGKCDLRGVGRGEKQFHICDLGEVLRKCRAGVTKA